VGAARIKEARKARDVTGKTSDVLRKTFDTILAELLKTIGASRTTLRLDDTKYGFHIDDVVAEAVAPGENSLRGQTSINQRAAATRNGWKRNRQLLVQGHLSSANRARRSGAHQALRRAAQMLAPVERGGSWMVGSRCTRRAAAELDRAGSAALRKAVEQVLRELV